MVGKFSVYHWARPARLGSNLSQMATISGRASISRRWDQRAAALANSRPINPQPIKPNRIFLMPPRLDSAMFSFLLPGITEVTLRFAQGLVDNIHALGSRIQIHHNGRTHAQNVAGGNPGQAVTEGRLVDPPAGFGARVLAGSVPHQLHTHQASLAGYVAHDGVIRLDLAQALQEISFQ